MTVAADLYTKAAELQEKAETGSGIDDDRTEKLAASLEDKLQPR
jgi:hypothetical protein